MSKFNNNNIIVVSILLLVSFVSCIKNDLPYPKIQQNILSLVAEGELSSATIDNNALTVELSLKETTDLKKVKFSQYTYTEGAESSVNFLEGTYDLSSPIKVDLFKYYSFEWTISAHQSIERYFSVAGQIGATIIDEIGRRVIVYVPDNLDKSKLEVTSIKLGPEGLTTITPEITVGVFDFSAPMHIEVSYFDVKEEWTIYVDTTDAIVSTTQVDAWTNVIWAYGSAPEDAENGFQYKTTVSVDWIDLPKEYITYNGGAFYAYIPHLKAQTEYVVRAVSDENIGNEIIVKTEGLEVLPNPSFDNWWLNDKVWCPWEQDGVSFWDTGNTGAATLGQSNVLPSDDTPLGFGKSAKLETKFIGIAGVGKLAAGSIYSGSFRKVDGTNGILDFGRPWSTRPTKLKGYYKYTSNPIDYASEEWKHLVGQPDTCNIYVMLTDWNSPFEIRTNPKNRQLLDLNSPEIIAYGEFRTGTSTEEWVNFEIEFKYRATNRKPKYIVVAAAASRLGDYFTGGTGTTLYVDEFSLEYDY